jgi:hypothetical protein
MAYADNAALGRDAEFYMRLTACISQEAIAKGVADPLAATCLRDPNAGTALFLPFTTSHQDIVDFYADPGGGGQQNIPDQAILSAVQADWAAVAAVNSTAPAA